MQRTNRVTGIALVALAAFDLALLLIGWATMPPGPPPEDEGTLAHLFQLAVVAQVPLMLVFLATADRSRPFRSLRPLALQLALLGTAFVLLFRLEHPSEYALLLSAGTTGTPVDSAMADSLPA